MYSYIARRLAFGALTVIGVSIMVFVVMRILPGDPLVAIFGPEGFTKLSDKERAGYMAALGLSDPLWVQYLAWVKDIVRGDFGHSFFRSESVADMILRRGPLTAEIALLSMGLSWLVGIPVALVSALRPNTLTDSAVRFVSILFLAVPGFWVGMLIVLGLLFWFGYRAPMAGVSLFADPLANLQLVVGPAIVLGLGQAAYIARMGRSSLLEVIREDYVRTARAKGLNSRLVIACTRCPMRSAGDHAVGRADGPGAGRIDPGRARLRHAGSWLRDVHRGQRARRLRHAEPGVPLCRGVRAAEHRGRRHDRLARSPIRSGAQPMTATSTAPLAHRASRTRRGCAAGPVLPPRAALGLLGQHRRR